MPYFFFSIPFQAKRDPYRFRFPIEMRFVDPNIDHLMYVASVSSNLSETLLS